MISSNFLDSGQEMPSRQGSFFEVETSLQDYIRKATGAFSDELAPSVESNYFISMTRAIENLWSEYAPFPDAPSSELLTKVKGNSYLIRWFSMIVSMILFSGNTLNQITLMPEKSGIYIQDWKKTLSCFGGNLDNGTGLNVYTLSKDSPSDIVGCCSDRYFVIPPKSFPSSHAPRQWKNFYFGLCRSRHTLEEDLQSRNVIEKILLFLSAKSMPDIQSSPLGIVKKILLEVNLLTSEQMNVLQKQPLFGRKIGGIAFFHVTSAKIPNELLTDSIYLMKKEKTYHALYPIKEELIEKIENGTCTIEKLTMSTKERSSIDFTSTWATEISISAKFKFLLVFERMNQNGEIIVQKCFFPVNEKFVYQKEQIFSIRKLPTFCMYPDITLKFEDECRNYTYFSIPDCVILSEPNGNIPVIDSVTIEDVFSDSPQSKKMNLGDQSIFYRTVQKPQHLMRVTNAKSGYMGCILNLRIDEIQYPVLLSRSIDKPVDLSQKIELSQTKLYAYIDFGNSHSMIGYKTDTGLLQCDSLSGHTPIIRKLLAGFCEDTYQQFLNFKVDASEMETVASLSIRYDSDREDIIPYHHAWQLFSYFELLSKVTPEENGKETLLLDADMTNPNTATVIYHLCYTAVCHAVDSSFGELFLFPIYSSKYQYAKICPIWDNAVKTFSDMFNIKIHCLLSAKNHEVLLESLVASSQQFDMSVNNCLLIDVNIGNAITEMSAVFIDGEGKKTFCAHSALPFGGKNLLKASVKNMLMHTKSQQDRKAFMIHLLHQNIELAKSHVIDKTGTAMAIQMIPEASMNSHNSSWIHYLDIPMELSVEELDIKFQADLLLRYGALMEVVKDFIHTARQMCEYNEGSKTSICFSGTASKLLQSVALNNYFRSFGIDCFPEIITTEKKQMMENFGRILCTSNKEGGFNLHGMKIDFPSEEVTDTRSFHNILGSPRQSGCLSFDFRNFQTADDIDGEFYAHNMESFRNPQNSMPSRENLWNDIRTRYQRTLDTFSKESSVKNLMKDIFQEVPPALWFERYQLDVFPDKKAPVSSSFYRACNTEIYPEMLRSTVYLFFTERFLSQYFGVGFSGKPMLTGVDEESEEYRKYKFYSIRTVRK